MFYLIYCFTVVLKESMKRMHFLIIFTSILIEKEEKCVKKQKKFKKQIVNEKSTNIRRKNVVEFVKLDLIRLDVRCVKKIGFVLIVLKTLLYKKNF
jgi:hypothetical protein